MSEEVDTSIVNEEQESPMEAESETAGQQSNGDAEEEEDTTKQEEKEESSPKKKVKENASPKKKLKEDASPKKKVKEDASPKKKVKEDASPKKKVKEDASPKKKVDKEEEEEEDGDDESSEEEELPLGSIEAPVQIMTGKRERKKTERLVFEETKKPQESMKEIKPGKGTKLGEIPNVSFQINKTNSEFLKPLNSLLFGFIGKMTMVKKNVRQFSGFQFEKDDPEYKKKEQKLFKFTLVGLKELCIWFDLERGGTKDQICDRILAFLLKPEPSGRPLPEKKKKAVKKPSKKRKRKEDESGDGEKKSKKEKKEKKTSENDADAANDSVDSVSSLSPDSDEEDEEPKKKKAKVEKKTPKKAAASPKKSATPKKKPEKKKTPKKASTPKTKTPKKTTPKKAASYDSDSSDDEPLVKKKSAPSESQIKDTIKKFLAKANLEEVTMKIVCKKVYETYPDFDLTHKKDFIKSTVKTIIS